MAPISGTTAMSIQSVSPAFLPVNARPTQYTLPRRYVLEHRAMAHPRTSAPAGGSAGSCCQRSADWLDYAVAWLGREDSNLRMAESKSAALPLGDAPSCPAVAQRVADHSSLGPWPQRLAGLRPCPRRHAAALYLTARMRRIGREIAREPPPPHSAAARVSMFSASQRSASSAAMQPMPAAVTAWRHTSSVTSPAANTPGMLVTVEFGAVSM